MSRLAELTLELKDVLTHIRMADPYEAARLSKEAAQLTTQIRREKALGPAMRMRHAKAPESSEKRLVINSETSATRGTSEGATATHGTSESAAHATGAYRRRES
jgi:hypothetical protein